ncbi:hypothetical protein [Flavobacterium sp.]|uniref:hypothetical protein n=1 Tax=Flavobacterium sp. TaxID=239 RepID=UPI0011F9F3FB|nr:hypothetical protein [Flavobacterium sp.]RZJ73508.1 MAG: hypothetical protein EOO49_01455 [Flavobacterium sp.]
MKTEATKKAKRQNRTQSESESFFVTLPSTMNYKSEFENEQEEAFGYPDFYEDTDNMNRYLW